MLRYRIAGVIALLLLPALIRGLWYYRGVYRPPDPIQLPAFSEIRQPEPPGESDGAKAQPVQSGIGKTVLIDTAHENQFQLSEIQSLTEQLSQAGARLEVVPSDYEFDSKSLQDRLKYADALLVISPFQSFSEAETREIHRFVERGGRLMVILDPTRAGGGLDLFGFLLEASATDVTIANRLLGPLGLSFSDDYLYNLVQNEGNYRNVFLRPGEQHPLTEGLARVTFYASRSVSTEGGSRLLVGDLNARSSRTDAGGGLAAMAISPDGGALALGDFSFMAPPYNQVADNALLIRNLASFLLSGERQRELMDLPFVFDRPVEVLLSPSFGVQAETLRTLKGLQDALQGIGLPMSVTQEPSQGSDLVVLALFEPTDETDPYIELLDLTLPIDHEDGLLVVPGFGEVDPAGIGVLGLVQGPERNLLVVLTEDKEYLSQLTDSLSSGYLSQCVFAGRYALCEVGPGSGLAQEESFDFNFDFGFESEEIIIATPSAIP